MRNGRFTQHRNPREQRFDEGTRRGIHDSIPGAVVAKTRGNFEKCSNTAEEQISSGKRRNGNDMKTEYNRRRGGYQINISKSVTTNACQLIEKPGRHDTRHFPTKKGLREWWGCLALYTGTNPAKHLPRERHLAYPLKPCDWTLPTSGNKRDIPLAHEIRTGRSENTCFPIFV